MAVFIAALEKHYGKKFTKEQLINIKEKMKKYNIRMKILDNKNSPLAPIHGLKSVVFTVLA